MTHLKDSLAEDGADLAQIRDRAGPAGMQRKPFSLDTVGASLVGWELGGGPPVLLLHAGGERSEVWIPVAERLTTTQRVRCIAVDQRGHGASSGGADRLADFGDDAAQMVAALDEPCVVVGASLGGFAIVDALRHAATRVFLRGIVLVDVVPAPNPDRTRAFLAERDMTSTHGPLIDDILDSGPGLHALLASADLPVTMVRASQSSISVDEIDRLERASSDFTVTTVESDHLVARHAPRELADAIGRAVCDLEHGRH